MPNFMYYSKDKLMNGAFLFKHYVNDLFELKANGVTGSKILLNLLWGALCQTNTYRIRADSETEREIGDADIQNIYINNGYFHVKCVRHCDQYFKTNFGRIKPFVLSYARCQMYFKFRKYEDIIVRMHTDGFMTREEPEGILTGTNLGYTKFEGRKRVRVEGLNRIVPL
jgi:hypothetical protein